MMKNRKSIIFIVVIIFLIFIIIGMYVYSSPIISIKFLDYTKDWLSSKLHLPKHLVNAFAIPLAIGLIYIVKLISSTNKGKQKKGLYIYATFMFLFSILLYFVEKDWNFNPVTKESNFNFVRINGKLKKVPPTYKYDPIYGVEALPATTELVKQYEIQIGNKEITEVVRKIPTKDSRFFDSETGQPLLWYYQRPSGKLEFFDYSGNHPQFSNVKLTPVNDNIVINLFEYFDRNQDSMIIGNKETTARLKKAKEEYYLGKSSKEASDYFKSLIEK